MTGHRTPGEKRTAAAAQAAVARAMARAAPPPSQDDDQALAQLYPYVTHQRAAQIRRELQEDRNDRAAR